MLALKGFHGEAKTWHGLSYARFVYRDLHAHPAEFRPGDRITVEVGIAKTILYLTYHERGDRFEARR
jgi:hypothetical protein